MHRNKDFSFIGMAGYADTETPQEVVPLTEIEVRTKMPMWFRVFGLYSTHKTFVLSFGLVIIFYWYEQSRLNP